MCTCTPYTSSNTVCVHVHHTPALILYVYMTIHVHKHKAATLTALIFVGCSQVNIENQDSIFLYISVIKCGRGIDTVVQTHRCTYTYSVLH